MTEVDVAILGGGCAGLSLAARLADLDTPPSVCVVEQRTEYLNDRTWSFWAPRTNPWADLTSHRWDAWRFSDADHDVLQRSGGTIAYHSIAADRFATAMRKRIDQNDAVALELGVAAISATPVGDRVCIETDAGTIDARHVIDTRPAPTPPHTYGQRFVGYEVEFDRDRLDPTEVGLMLDMTADDLGFRFTYVLPFSERRALIEETRFGRVAPTERLEQTLNTTIAGLAAGAGHEIVRDERGFLPMTTTSPPPAAPGVVIAGVRAGAARPSTGYAFLRIQHWADVNAARLADGRPPTAHPGEPEWRHQVDRLFLRVLDGDPDLAPTLFSALAERVRPETLVRFLSDDARLVDFAQVVRALPKTPFLRELAASIRRSR